MKTYGNGLNLSIIYFWLITQVFQLCLYISMLLLLKMCVCCIYAYSLFVWDSRDLRSLYFSNFSSKKCILLKVWIQYYSEERFGSKLKGFFKIVLFFVVSQIGHIKRSSSLFCKEMNLKIEPPPYEQILWNYTYKTLGWLM